MSISQNLNLQPLAQHLSQVNNYLYINLIKSTKNEWINIFLHCEFAQNELEVRNKSFCDYLSVSQNHFKFLSASGNSGLSA
jgi:hypothetical protein